MLDRKGYRPNVGIIVLNRNNQVWWGRRAQQDSWQFPQGGINRGESVEAAMYRELNEEVGLLPEHVHIVGRTREWLRYDVPSGFRRSDARYFRGQKQIWFLLRLIGSETNVNIRSSDKPEFDAWCWSDYWSPLEQVVEFKREVYESALNELVRFLDQEPQPLPNFYLNRLTNGRRHS